MKKLKTRTLLSMVLVLKYFVVTTLVVTNRSEFVYFKENLPVKHRKDLEILQETVICEISLGRKKVFFVALYRSPNQSNEDFEEFYHKLQDNLDQIKKLKPHCTILTGDFNCRTKQFWPGDTDSPKGIALDELIESNNMILLIDQPTNLESRGISCVDLIITDQPNLFIDYGIHSSLDNCCHHQIIHGKVNPIQARLFYCLKVQGGFLGTPL